MSFELQKEVSALEREERDASQQEIFCHSLLQNVERGHLPMLLPTADVFALELEDIVQVPGFCAACSEMLAGCGAVGVYTLVCGHQYHPICFSHWVDGEKECADSTCEVKISKSAQSWLANNGTILD